MHVHRVCVVPQYRARSRQVRCTDAVIATGPAAFALTQQALSMTHFLEALHGRHAARARADPDHCITDTLRQHDLKQLTLRHLRCVY